MMLSYASVLLLVGALGAATLCTGNAQEVRRLLDDIHDPAQFNSIGPSQVLFRLKKALILDGSQEEVAQLIDAREVVKPKKCTVDYQQWLISQLVKSKGTPLEGYIKEIRDEYRQLCAKTFKTRMSLELLELEQNDINRVEALVSHLPETIHLQENVYKLDTLPLDSLVAAIKEYLSQETGGQGGVRVGSSSYSIIKSMESNQQTRASLAELKGACNHIMEHLYEFLWILKVIDRPNGSLGSVLESLLWKTKVCDAFQLEHFETELQVRYSRLDVEERELVAKFTNLLRVPKDFWSEPGTHSLERGSIKEALGMLTGERHFRSTSDAEELELAGQLLDDLDVACQSVLAATGPFMWLVDMELKQEVSLSSSSVLLKQARICSLLPFVRK